MGALDLDTQIAVIGAGAMGAGIAQVAAQAGHNVLLYDARPDAISQAIKNIDSQLGRRVAKGRLSAEQHSMTVARLQPAHSLSELADAGLIIEAIVEDLQVKRNLFRQLEDCCSADCIFASNTSSISITSLAAELRHPERMLGMHFFNPAPVMALVEIISGLASAWQLADRLYATALAWGKKPVHARSTPGFIVNRVARPFYAESLRLLEEGAADFATLDALLRDAGGFRMGAFELTDLIGHDVNYAVTCSVFEAYYGDPRFQPSLIQKELVDAGFLGRKSGRGFYRYDAAAVPEPVAALQSTADVRHCVVEGHLGVAQPLVQRLRDAGVEVSMRPGNGYLRVEDTVLALSDGRLATERARAEGLENLVLFDLAHDYASTSRLGLSWSHKTSPEALDHAVALLGKTAIAATPLSDIPGLAVLRTLAMLANEAAEALLHGVASAADIDLAMQAGVNYPQGPLAWADRVGADYILRTLENLQRVYGDVRYRPSLQIRRTVAKGGQLNEQH